uniref:NXPE C-terminal domain-containing protein n=2 Tax=Pyxicephalus adspersus TaxID=30357 RepID=A0AAV3A5A2_PYXAD|nr:TPA: hypothetical protein GDO54_013318 [Pyxicephalus adspersus]
MSRTPIKDFKIIVCFSIICITLLSYIIHLYMFKPSKILFPQVQHYLVSKEDVEHLTTIPSDNDQQVQKLLSSIKQRLVKSTFVEFNTTSSAKHSIATISSNVSRLCIGDTLTVTVEMFNYLGERKTHGGDFLRARIFSADLGAGASGRIEDFNNGTYKIYFTLFWEGHVQISILLLHPSEGVYVLWKLRNAGFKYIIFTGQFLNNSKEVYTECGFQLDSKQKELCEYSDNKYGEYFYCIKPQGVPCEAFISLKSDNTPYFYLNNKERKMFKSSNLGLEFPKNIGSVDVQQCNRNLTKKESKCKIGEDPLLPSGYFLRTQWNPVNCKRYKPETSFAINKCLSGKMIYFLGDSTLRQWIEYIPKVIKTLKFFDMQGKGIHRTHLALDLKNNLYVKWKKHGHPFVTHSLYTVKDYSSIAREIDQLAGGANTVIAVTLGQHFRAFPIILFIERLLKIRKAIENLLKRSPETKVIIKTENTREINLDVERFSDFHGYTQYLLMKEVFLGLNVGVIDAWDMTTAFGSYNAHPSETIIQNQINMLLSFIC